MISSSSRARLGARGTTALEWAMIESVTPLIAIDAIAFDTETTGLDVRTASIVEIGAVRIAQGCLCDEDRYRSLVRPAGPIDPASTKIHGFDQTRLRDAPTFAEVWPQFAAFAGEHVLIGHTIGFDLAIIERQLAAGQLRWRRPRLLDTQLLAQLARPRLGRRTLDELAEQFGIAVKARHSAEGDALLAARVFLALLPHLHAINIRTLGEAEAGCRSLIQSLDDYRRAGWIEPVAAGTGATTAGAAMVRRDIYAYRRRAADVMSTPPKAVTADVTVGEALSQMLQQQISSLFVADDLNSVPADQVGIVTERDLLRALSDNRGGAFDMRVGALMKRPLLTVPNDAFAYVAIARMRRLRIRHLGVVDERNRVVGALSARDLLRLHGEPAILVGDEIEQAEDIPSLSKAWAKLQVAIASLIEDIDARELAGLISQVLVETTGRASVLAERTLAAQGLGAAPSPYAVAVLGSAGRGESLLAADQDNAIVFGDGDPDGPQDRWFARLGQELSAILHKVGITYCPGGIMASNPIWRGSGATWRQRIDTWLHRSSPDDLLAVDVFFDLRPVHGEAELALALWCDAFDRAQDNAAFAKLLVASSAAHTTKGLGWFGRLNTEGGRIDLKRSGTFGLVTAARALAIRHHVIERSTFARLAGLRAKSLGHEIDFGRIEGALELFLSFILTQQLRDIAEGRQPSNKVAVQALSRFQREQLREALGAVEHVDDFVQDLLF
jgi:CBS domain-containing protein